MKISNIITTGVLAIFAGGAIGFGVYALTRPSEYINNNISYVLNDEKCFVKVHGEYEGPELFNGQASHDTWYDKESLMKGQSTQLPNWNIGHVILSESESSFSLTIEITNLAETDNNNQLLVDISNIAIDNSIEGIRKFSTKCTIDDVEQQLKPFDATSATLDSFSIDAGDTKTVKLVYSIEKFNEAIDTFYNNIKIEFNLEEKNV